MNKKAKNPQMLTQQERVRREKLDRLIALGFNPYPSASFFANATTEEVHQAHAKGKKLDNPTLSGRLMSRRIMGKASFGEIEDHRGRLQLYFHRDTLTKGEDGRIYDELLKKLLDIGDIIGVSGEPFVTKKGTLALRVERLCLLSKAIKPLPSVKEVEQGGEKKQYYTLSDPEQRYRQRYVDLILNKKARDTFIKRAKIIQTLRDLLNKSGYLEVETPILQPIYGGAFARPFKTHHNTLDIPLYLRISNELYLKRLIVGGYPGVYEFAKDFRNEGMSRFHNPEFTLLEFYVPFRDYYWMMEQIESMLGRVVEVIHGEKTFSYGAHRLDFGKKWKRITFMEAILEYAQIDLRGASEGEILAACKKLGVASSEKANKTQMLDAIFSAHCEPKMIQPTFVTNHPIEMSPLAKSHRDNPELSERFEVICCGKEICNAYSELNDPIRQQAYFSTQKNQALLGDEEAMQEDVDYLRALGCRHWHRSPCDDAYRQ